MTPYIIRNDGYNFQQFGLEIGDLTDIIPPDTEAAKVYDFSLHNFSFKNFWKDVHTSFIPVEGHKDDPLPDICRWIGATLVLSPKAFSLLSDLISPFGECLSVDVNGETYTIFNCLTFADVDKENSAQRIKHGEIMGITKLAFDAVDITDKILFKTDYNRCLDIFCTDAFKMAVEKNNLTGLSFSTELAPEF